MVRKHCSAMILLMLCIPNMHGQVVVSLPFYEDFSNYTPDSIRFIDATHYYLSAYHSFGGWEVCTRGYVLSTNYTTGGPMHHNSSYDGKVRMDYASAEGDYLIDTTYDYRCGGTLLASPWFYELPRRVTFEYIVPRPADMPDNVTLPLEIEIGVLTDSVPDTTTMSGWNGNQSSWPFNPTCGRDFIPFSTQTYTFDSNNWQPFDVNVLGMFDNSDGPPYRIAFRTKCCDTSYVLPALSSVYIDDIHIFPAYNTTYDTLFYFDTICRGAVYAQNGFNIARTDTVGTFDYDHFEVVNDSSFVMYFLRLTILANSDTVLYDTIFVGESLDFLDTVLTDSGTYTFIINATNGCDSTVTLCLHTVLLMDTVEIYDTICMGELYEDYGFSIHPDEIGTYTYERDSTEATAQRHYQLVLTVWPTYFLEDRITIASGDTLFFEGMAITNRGDYQFRYTNRYGCDSTILLHVRLDNTHPEVQEEYCSIWFPDIFTPAMETNNRFRGYLDCEYKNYKLSVFDRWGTFIFSTTDLEGCWDGTAKGQALPQGSYIYRYEVNSKEGRFYSGIGTVTLIR